MNDSLPEIRYLNTSALKVAIAAWHREEFERLEDGYDESRGDLVDASG